MGSGIFYNLSDRIKDLWILLITDLWVAFHSSNGWELMNGLIYKDFGLIKGDQN